MTAANDPLSPRTLVQGVLVLATATTIQACGGVADTRPSVIIDGQFQDWTIPSTVVVDSADAPDGEVDLGEVRVANDARALFVLVDLGREVNAQGLRGGLSLFLDTDGESSTGHEVLGMRGVDLQVEFSGPDRERPGHAREGVAVRTVAANEEAAASSDHWDPAVIGLRFEPRHTTRRIELRIERELTPPIEVPFLSGDTVRGKLAFRSETGRLVDDTPVFNHPLQEETSAAVSRLSGDSPASTPSSAPPVARLERPADARLRVVSWNVSRDHFLRYRDSFVRVLASVRPDVVLLDEVPPDATPEMLRSFFARVGGGPGAAGWQALVGAGGGRQRGVIAARSPIEQLTEFERVPYPRATLDLLSGAREEDFAAEPWRALQEVVANTGGAGIPTVGGIVERSEGRVVAVTLDLVCCGNRDGSLHDQVRRLEATAIHDATERALTRGSVDAVIVGGDFNLVGSRTPLDRMARGLDADGSDLSIADPLQLDRVSSATWESVRGPFPPGQLDYLLYSDSSLELLQAFVLDTRDVPDDVRQRMGLREDDTERASDHLPLVADFRWRDRTLQ